MDCPCCGNTMRDNVSRVKGSDCLWCDECSRFVPIAYFPSGVDGVDQLDMFPDLPTTDTIDHYSDG